MNQILLLGTYMYVEFFTKTLFFMILIGFLWQNSSNVETLVDLQKQKTKNFQVWISVSCVAEKFTNFYQN